jgi:hypothetical protein
LPKYATLSLSAIDVIMMWTSRAVGIGGCCGAGRPVATGAVHGRDVCDIHSAGYRIRWRVFGVAAWGNGGIAASCASTIAERCGSGKTAFYDADALKRLRMIVYAVIHAFAWSLDDSLGLIGRPVEIDRRIAITERRSSHG